MGVASSKPARTIETTADDETYWTKQRREELWQELHACTSELEIIDDVTNETGEDEASATATAMQRSSVQQRLHIATKALQHELDNQLDQAMEPGPRLVLLTELLDLCDKRIRYFMSCEIEPPEELVLRRSEYESRCVEAEKAFLDLRASSQEPDSATESNDGECVACTEVTEVF